MQFVSSKNFKTGRLISSKYRIIDLFLLGGGIIISFMMILFFLLFLNGTQWWMVCLMALPAAVCFFLTMPAGIYHNILEFIKVYMKYRIKEKKYYWEGIWKDDIRKE